MELDVLKLLDDSIEEVEIIFLTPDRESFTGTPIEIARELDRRMLLYGTCSYEIPAKTTILLDMEK